MAGEAVSKELLLFGNQTTPIIHGCILAILLLYCLIKWLKYFRVPENFPPGPPSFPFLGVLPFIKVKFTFHPPSFLCHLINWVPYVYININKYCCMYHAPTPSAVIKCCVAIASYIPVYTQNVN